MALTKVPSNLDSVTATTQSQGDGSTNVATTAYVDTGLANLIDSAPSNLNTLNELAAAMNDNASFFSTVLPLSGGTMTGNIAHAGDFTLDVGGDITFDAGGGDILFKDDGTLVGTIGGFAGNNVTIKSEVSDGDVIIQGNDGGSSITALTLDMSDAGSAYFNNDVYVDKYFRLRTTDDQANSWLLYTNTNDNFEINYNGAGNAEVVVNTSGNVGIGTTSPGYTLDVSGGSGTMSRIQSGGASTYLAIKNSSNTGYVGVDSNNLEFYPTSSKAATLQSSGNLFIGGTLTQSYSFSDERLKENITVITDAIDKVKALRGITFTRKKDNSEGTGLIAQELEKVLPQAVYEPEPQIDKDPITGEARGETPETYKAIHYEITVGLLVEAIKELSTKLEAAETRITTLEG